MPLRSGPPPGSGHRAPGRGRCPERRGGSDCPSRPAPPRLPPLPAWRFPALPEDGHPGGLFARAPAPGLPLPLLPEAPPPLLLLLRGLFCRGVLGGEDKERSGCRDCSLHPGAWGGSFYSRANSTLPKVVEINSGSQRAIWLAVLTWAVFSVSLLLDPEEVFLPS